MKLKVKSSGWSAGRPVAIMNEASAKELGIKVNDRVLIKSGLLKIISVVDISSRISKKDHIVLSTEIMDFLHLRKNSIIDVEFSANPQVTQIIHKKFRREKLSESEILTIIKAIVNNALTETEIAFFISAIYENGMSFDEIAWMTKAMVSTGKVLSFKNKIVVDKHSIGGIAGNRTTPIVVSICSSAGLTFPKTSSRAITSAAGTADVIEAICNVEFSPKEVEKIVRKVGACLVWGGSLGFAPADDKIIKVESQINIDPEPNLIASIMAKKLAVGSKYILIDIPYGRNAKVNKKEALALKNKFEILGKKFHIHLKAVITEGSQPIGNGIGPVLELRDIFSVLKGDGPEDLRKKSVMLAGEIFDLCKKTKKGSGKNLAEKILSSGKAYEKFLQIIKAQGGKYPEGKYPENSLDLAQFSHTVLSHKSGKIYEINNKQVNLLARIAGSPSDKKAGVYLWKHAGNRVEKNNKLLTIYAQSKNKLRDAVDFYNKNKLINIK